MTSLISWGRLFYITTLEDDIECLHFLEPRLQRHDVVRFHSVFVWGEFDLVFLGGDNYFKEMKADPPLYTIKAVFNVESDPMIVYVNTDYVFVFNRETKKIDVFKVIKAGSDLETRINKLKDSIDF